MTFEAVVKEQGCLSAGRICRSASNPSFSQLVVYDSTCTGCVFAIVRHFTSRSCFRWTFSCLGKRIELNDRFAHRFAHQLQKCLFMNVFSLRRRPQCNSVWHRPSALPHLHHCRFGPSVHKTGWQRVIYRVPQTCLSFLPSVHMTTLVLSVADFHGKALRMPQSLHPLNGYAIL